MGLLTLRSESLGAILRTAHLAGAQKAQRLGQCPFAPGGFVQHAVQLIAVKCSRVNQPTSVARSAVTSLRRAKPRIRPTDAAAPNGKAGPAYSDPCRRSQSRSAWTPYAWRCRFGGGRREMPWRTWQRCSGLWGNVHIFACSDKNPRYACTYGGLPDRRLKPLGPPSRSRPNYAVTPRISRVDEAAPVTACVTFLPPLMLKAVS
jgi:hypothetical protein